MDAGEEEAFKISETQTHTLLEPHTCSNDWGGSMDKDTKRQTDGQTTRQTYIRMDGWTSTLTHTHTPTHTHRQTDWLTVLLTD